MSDFYKGFIRGRESVYRKNKSGCCCIIDDSGNVINACGAHEEWLELALEKSKNEEDIVSETIS
jgi:hypothetical protein